MRTILVVLSGVSSLQISSCVSAKLNCFLIINHQHTDPAFEPEGTNGQSDATACRLRNSTLVWTVSPQRLSSVLQALPLPFLKCSFSQLTDGKRTRPPGTFCSTVSWATFSWFKKSNSTAEFACKGTQKERAYAWGVSGTFSPLISSLKIKIRQLIKPCRNKALGLWMKSSKLKLSR